MAGTEIFLAGIGKPIASIKLDFFTPTLTLTRTGGGAFSLVGFDHGCDVCDFTVGATEFTSGSGGLFTFAPASLAVTDVASIVFTWKTSAHLIDNIVLTWKDVTPVPVPAALPLLLAGVGGLGLMARRKARAA